jgi:transcription initiation factor TFIIB
MTDTIATSYNQEETNQAERETNTRQHQVCPECEGQVIHDEYGEQTCNNCGLVLDDSQIDHGPEWRSFQEETNNPSRVGAPVTELIHDKGLSTTISWKNIDGYGNSIPSEKRHQLQRLRKWDERLRTKDSQERNLKQAFGELQRMASALGLPEPCRETAGVLYRQAVENELLPGRSIEAMTTASLYAAARQHDTPRTLTEFESVSRVERLSIQRAYRYLSRELELAIKPADPIQYLRQYTSDLNVSSETERLAQNLIETGKEQGLHSGRSPAGLAAAAVYAATHLTNEKLTQATVSDTAGVSKVTIRNRYQELLDVYGEQR